MLFALLGDVGLTSSHRLVRSRLHLLVRHFMSTPVFDATDMSSGIVFALSYADVISHADPNMLCVNMIDALDATEERSEAVMTEVTKSLEGTGEIRRKREWKKAVKEWRKRK